jgi:DNA-binding NarL/FixJ family response regulator
MTGTDDVTQTAGTAAIRVIAADDQRVVREGLALILSLLPGVEVAGTAADGEEALALAAELKPDVVLMDLRMPGIGGVEAIRRMRAADPSVSVIALTTYADDRSVISAIQAGAAGYLTKDAGGGEILQALERVRNGQVAIDPAVQRHLVDAIAASGSIAAAMPGQGTDPAVPVLPDGLTPREAEVLGLIAAGLSNAEIATRLFISETTVKSHINHMLPKISARDRAQAVSYAYQHGLAAHQRAAPRSNNGLPGWSYVAPRCRQERGCRHAGTCLRWCHGRDAVRACRRG